MNKNKILRAAFFTPTQRGWGLPLLLWAAPGTAKTSVVRQLASSLDVPCEILSPGERGEGAFGVVPVPHSTGSGAMSLTYPAPDWALDMGAKGLILADELTTAPPAIQPAILGLALEGRIGGYAMPPHVRVFAAANPVECSAAGYELPAPSANRFCHMTWEIDVAEVAAFFMTGVAERKPDSEGIEVEEARVMSRWEKERSKAAGSISSFLTRHPDLMHKMPADGDPNRGRAWPSPRTWEMALRALASSAIHHLSEEEADVLCGGCVGNSAWMEFRTYQAALDLPDPCEVLDNPSSWKIDTKRLDRTAAVLSSCVALVIPKEADKRLARITALWALLGKVGESGACDLAVAPAGNLVRAGLITGTDISVARKVLSHQALAGFTDLVRASDKPFV